MTPPGKDGSMASPESLPIEMDLKPGSDQTAEVLTSSRAFDIIIEHVGHFNTFQWRIWFYVGVGGFLTALPNLGAVFLGATPDHWCHIPFFDGKNESFQIMYINHTTPWVRGKDGTLEPSKCSFYDYNYTLLLSEIENDVSSTSLKDLSSFINPKEANVKRCDVWSYDDSIFTSTVVTEWNLVCSRRWLMSSIQSSYMMGILAGAVFFSALSDKIGRRWASLMATTLFFVSSVTTSFSDSFLTFIILRFIIAGSGQGMVLVNFILLMECVSHKGRNLLGISYHYFFSLGIVALSLIAYYITDWRTLQLVCGVPTVILLGYYWYVEQVKLVA